MSVSRRRLLINAVAASALPQIVVARRTALGAAQSRAVDSELAPHSSPHFWNGFFDSVNPKVGDYRESARGTGQLAAPDVETNYLHYKSDEMKLRYATDITRDELLDYDGDVVVSIQISQFRPGLPDQRLQASQLRIDATQTRPFLNILAPLGWTAIASLKPDSAGKIPSLDQLGFTSDQALQATSRIMFTQGTGKLAVNVSRAPNDSGFLAALKVMITGARLLAPLVTLPEVSVPALSTFSEAFAYWENRTRFLINGNLVTVIATRQALDDPDRDDSYIGLISGDYIMVPDRDTDALAKNLSNLMVEQGYLVHKDADRTIPLAKRADMSIPGVTYASMKVSVAPAPASVMKPSSSTTSASTPAPEGGQEPEKGKHPPGKSESKDSKVKPCPGE